jgi:hypothetical protein
MHYEEYEEYMDEAREEGYSAAEIAEYLEYYTIVPTMYGELLFNRYKTNVAIQGLYKAYFYVSHINYITSNVLAVVIFNEAQNIPNIRVSSEEYGYSGRENIGPFGWNNVSLKIPNIIEANSNIWLGLISSGVGINFDYGATFFDILSLFGSVGAQTAINNGQHLGSVLAGCGGYIPDYFEYALEDEEIMMELRPSVRYAKTNAHPKRPGNYNLKFSYYIQSVSTAYTRTLTAGIKLTDSRKGAYTAIRKVEQTAKTTQTIGRAHNATRKSEQTVKITDNPIREKGMYRLIETLLPVSDFNKTVQTLTRTIGDILGNVTGIINQREIRRDIADTTHQTDMITRSRGIFAFVHMILGLDDITEYSNLWGRNVEDGVSPVTDTHHEAEYLRELRETPAAADETIRVAGYIRLHQDTGNVVEDMKRMLTVFIKLFSVTSIRDYIINRFLKSREELVIKSKINREIEIESRIH